MALESKKGATGTEGLGARIEVSNDGGTTFNRLRGGDNTSYTPGDRESGTTSTYDGVVSYLGPEQIGDVQMTFPAWTPNLYAWEVVRDAKRDNADLLWRIRTVEPSVLVGQMMGRTGQFSADPDPANALGSVLALTAPAVGSAGRRQLDALITGDVVKAGHIIFIEGDRWRTIEEVEVDPDVRNGAAGRWRIFVRPLVGNAATPGAAAKFQIESPRYEWLFTGGVKNFNAIQLPASGTLGTTLTVTPNSPLDLADLANADPTF